MRSAREAVQLTLNEYRAGTVAFTTVITAQTTLLTDERAALTIQEARLVASVEPDPGAGRRLGQDAAAGGEVPLGGCARHPLRLAQGDEVPEEAAQQQAALPPVVAPGGGEGAGLEAGEGGGVERGEAA